MQDANIAERLQQNTDAQNADLRGLTKMAVVIVTLKIMPEDPSIDLESVKEKAGKIITEFEGKVQTTNEEPVGFGLKAIVLSFSVDESRGSPDPIAEKIEELKEVKSAQVTMVSRALG